MIPDTCPSPLDELFELASAHVAGELESSDAARLDLLLQDPGAARAFWRYCSMHASLEWEFGEPGSIEALGEGRSGVLRKIGVLGFAAAAALAFTLAYSAREGGAPSESSTRIIHAVSATWDPAREADAGVELGVEYRLVSGWCAIQTGEGVTAVFHGPAEFMFESPTDLVLDEGLVTAHAPTERVGEFVVRTPHGRVTDLGTRFAVETQVGGSTRAFVREGTVVLTTDVATLTIEAGRGGVIAGGDTRRFDNVRWVGEAIWPGDALAMLDAGAGSDEAAWLVHATAALRRGGASLWLDATADGVVNRVATSKVELLEVDGPAITHGRLEGGHAMRFGPQDDPLRLHIPETFDRVTLVSWVRFDSGVLPPGREHRGLLMSELWGETGAAHWQAKDRDFRLTFAHPSHEPHAIYDADRSDLHTGVWTMLATVYDSGARTVTHYRNGAVVAVEPMTGPRTPLHFGPTLVGATLPATDEPEGIRMGGELDDLMLWPRALSEAELSDLYEHGRPG